MFAVFRLQSVSYSMQCNRHKSERVDFMMKRCSRMNVSLSLEYFLLHHFFETLSCIGVGLCWRLCDDDTGGGLKFSPALLASLLCCNGCFENGSWKTRRPSIYSRISNHMLYVFVFYLSLKGRARVIGARQEMLIFLSFDRETRWWWTALPIHVPLIHNNTHTSSKETTNTLNRLLLFLLPAVFFHYTHTSKLE